MALYLTVTNSQFDSAIAAATSPVGAITRVGSVPAVSPNAHLPVLCSTSMGGEFHISYNDLTDATRLHDLLIQLHSGPNINADIQDMLDSFEVVVDAAKAMSGPPYTNAERTAIMKALQVFSGQLNSLPNHTWIESANDDILSVSSVAITSPAALTGRVVATITGEVSYAAIRWTATGNFVPFVPATSGATTVNNTYSGAGTYAVTVVIFGPGGFYKRSGNITVAGA